jgi:hypothetical protein
MSDEPLTTPPVHDAGPAAPDREIEGGLASRTGFRSRLVDALEVMADELAVKHTSMPIVVPAGQIADVVAKLVPDMPRVPDYDHVSALAQRWSETTVYSPSRLPDREPSAIGVRADRLTDRVLISVEIDGKHEMIGLDPESARGFFLAGLAAVEFLKAERGPQYLTPSGLPDSPFRLDRSDYLGVQP